MDENTRAVRDLLTSQRVLALGLIVDGGPLVSLLPYALADDFSTAYVHASQLARHYRALAQGGAFSALIHADDDPEQDALQVPRLTINGDVVEIERDTPAYEDAREVYVRRFPDSAVTFELADFSLFGLKFREGRFVQGFARTWNVSLDQFKQMAQ